MILIVRRKMSAVPYVRLTLLLLLLPLLMTNHESLCYGYLAPPNRTLPAELIVLENGSTTFIAASSLEEFLDSTTIPPPPSSSSSSSSSAELKKNTTHQSLSIEVVPAPNHQLERESDHQASPHEAHQESKPKESHHETTVDKKQNLHAGSSGGGGGGHHASGNEAGGGNTSAPKPIPQHWQVKSLLNVTHDYPLEYSQIICGYVWPLMAAITLFTNLMIVFVLTQRDMRTPTNVVLTAIAIADIIPIVVPVPWFVYLFAMGNEKQVLYPPIACYFYQHSTRSVSEIFYFLSTWLNVLLAVQDYLTACWPKLAKKYCQIKVVIIEIVALTLLAFLLNLPQALKLVFKPIKFYYNGQLTWGCRALQAKWFKDIVGEYVALYDDIFTAIIVVFVDGGPAIALITLTALLIKQLHRQRIQGHLLMEQARTASKRRRERHRQQEYEASARVMIFVLLAFLAVKIPFATTYTLMIIQSRFEIHFVENLVDFQKAITLTDLVFVLSYPINFTIFCSLSKKFRHKCAQLLGECNQNTTTAKNRLMSSFSSSFNSDNTTTISQMYNNNNNNNNNHHHHQPANQTNESIKRDSLGTMLSAKRDSSVSLLLGAAERGNKYATKRDSMTTTGSIVCCNGTSGRKLSQPQSAHSYSSGPGDDRQQQQQQHVAPHRMLPSPIPEDVSGSRESVRALADDGLCVECILRYEQMKRSSGSIAASYHLQQQQQHHQQRRPSNDSGSSWHVSLPPPPPPLQFCRQQQLPHIVTTRCESIREGSSPEEVVQHTVCAGGPHSPLVPADSAESSGADATPAAGSVHTHDQSGAGVAIEADLSEARGRIQSRGFNGSSARGSSDPGTMRGALRQQSIGYGYRLDEHYPGRDIRSASHSNESVSSVGFDDGHNSRRHDHGGGSGSGGDRKGQHLRAPMLNQLEDKHRSLSMSNSKLTALAGATGLLADIIKSTLLTTNPSAGCSPSSSSPQHKQHKQARHFTFHLPRHNH